MFKYTMTAEPVFKKVKAQIFNKKTKRQETKLTKTLRGYYPVYRKKLGEIVIWSNTIFQLCKTEAEAKALAKEKLTQMLTKGSKPKTKLKGNDVMVQVYSTILNKKTGQIMRIKY